MTTSLRWTTADLEEFPRPLDDTRYEIIDGELYVSTQPSVRHQYSCGRVASALTTWSDENGLGVTLIAPGLVFAEDENVAPDVVWLTHDRLRMALCPDEKLHRAPELVVEVLSPGAKNEHRDRVAKVGLYSRQGVQEYWLPNPLQRQVEVYRRQETDLRLIAVLESSDRLESPLLPLFSLSVRSLFLPEERYR